MTALDLLFYVFACFGLSFVLAYAKITLPLRECLAAQPSALARWALAWMECIACTGWWIGLVTALVLAPRFAIPRDFIPLACVALAFFSCGSNFVLGRLTRLID